MLSDEKHFAILGKGPQLVVYDELQLVDMVADEVHQGRYGIVVGDGLLALVLELVGYAAGVGELLCILGDEAAVLAYLLDEGQVVGAELLGGLFREDFLHLVDVVDKLALVAGGYGDDVI